MEISWKDLNWEWRGRAGPFEVYASPQGRWFKLSRAEDDGKTRLDIIITDREARDMLDCLASR